MRGKVYKAVKEKAPTQAVGVRDAIEFLKQHARSTFDESIEVHVRLGVDASKSDQMVRASAILPGGSPKEKTIAVIAEGADAQTEAKEAGAQIVGGQELIDDIATNEKIDADVVVATPDMMPKIAKVAKILGPKGLMPNPKTGTVTSDIAKTVKELTAGKVSFKMDLSGNIHESVGKVSWETKNIEDNIRAIIEAIRAARPTAAKGELIKTVSVASTMSPGIRVNL